MAIMRIARIDRSDYQSSQILDCPPDSHELGLKHPVQSGRNTLKRLGADADRLFDRDVGRDWSDEPKPCKADLIMLKISVMNTRMVFLLTCIFVAAGAGIAQGATIATDPDRAPIAVGQMSNSREIERDFSGLASLSICESLLLALADRKVLSQRDIRGLLEDAADAHRNAVGTSQEIERHRAVAGIIDRILAGRHLSD